MKKTVILLFTVTTLLLSGCSSLPDALITNNPSVITDYEQWVNSPDPSGSEVRLGGVIASVTNLEAKTRLEIVNLPIANNGKPNINVEPQGRYVAYIDGFVDPVSYAKGRLVSVLGIVKGHEMGKVGDFDYRFPVLDASGYHLWKIREKVLVQEQPMSLFPCRSLYCREVRYGPTMGQVIQQVE